MSMFLMRSLFLKTLYDKRWFTLGWSLAMGLVILLVLSFYPAFSEGNAFEDLAKSIPPQFKELIGDPSTYKTVPGYISQQIFDIRVPLLFMIMAISLGLSLSIAEEEKEVLRTTLATPLSRGRIVLEKWLAAVVIVGAVSIAGAAGIYFGVEIINESIDFELVWQLSALAWLFGAASVAIPLGLGLATGNKSLTMGISVVATIGSFILSTFEKAVDWLEPFEKYSLMHYYDANQIADSGIAREDALAHFQYFP